MIVGVARKTGGVQKYQRSAITAHLSNVVGLVDSHRQRGPRGNTMPYSLAHASYHSSMHRESTLIIGGAGMLVGAVLIGKIIDFSAARQASESAKEDSADGASVDSDTNDNTSKASDTTTVSENDFKKEFVGTLNDDDENTTKASPAERAAQSAKEREKAAAAKKAAKAKAKAEAGPSGFDQFMTEVYAAFGGDWKEAKAGFFAKNFYDGGFEDKMTRREAALILGVRENSAAQRIKEQHRKVLLLNHPDRGGSPYVAAKINLAKDLLIQGKGK